MTPQSVPLPDDEEEDGAGAADAGVEEGDADVVGTMEEEETIVANVVGAGDDEAGRATSAFILTA